MACYLRPKRPGATIFFTLCLARQGNDLLVTEIAALRRAFRDTMRDRPFRIDACVILPDHLHCIWTLPPDDLEYSTRWRLIKGRFAHHLAARPRSPSKHRKSEKGIWQRRFWEHHIRNARDHAMHLRYCHTDPVRHGLVTSPQDWPYSTALQPDTMRIDTLPPLPMPDFGEFAARRCP